MKKSLLLLAISALALISGCSQTSDKSDLISFMSEVDRRPKGRIPPPPSFEPEPLADYKAFSKKSPFEPPKNVEEVVRQIQLSSIRPNEDRVKEYLEQFRIESLLMVGTIQMLDADRYALIRDGNGEVHELVVGNYMGKNHGRVLEIDENSITLLEIVPNGQGGWVERPRTLELRVVK